MVLSMSFTLELLTNHITDVASWLKTPRLRKEDKLCPENIQFMKGVLDRCLRECDHYTAFDFLPSRLLDLGPQMSLDSIRLIDSSQIAPKDGNPAPRYAALSYCWGSPLATDKVPHLCTTMQSMESMKRHVHEQTIPPTILDAINVCKALSIRYLWVDSLCIIQDNKSDWERESLSMTLIYKNAFVTICTPSSKSSNEGFLVQPRRHVAVPFRSQLVPSIYGHYNLVASGTCCQDEYPTWPEMDVDGTSWSSRGWTLQEFQMSNRVLIFGKSMIHFQCHHSVQSENGCQRDSAGPRIIRTLDSYGPEEYPAIYYIEWGSMLYDYQRRLFSVIEDKLPAISGMAKYIADETGDEYLAGLWKSRLPSALVWHADCDNNVKYHIELPDLLSTLYSPKPYISPSWSPVRLDVDVRPKFSFYLDDFETTKLIERSTVVDASVKPIGENPFGRVQGGRIRIRGRLATVSSDLTRLPCDSEGDLWYTLDQGYITYYKLDFFPERNSCNHQGKLSRLLIYSEQTGGTLHEDGHDGAREEARHCLVNHLPSYAANHGSSPNLTIAGCSSQAEQHSDKPESESGSSHSSRLSVAGSSKEIETKIHTQPSPNSDGSPEESKSPPTWDWTDTERTHARIDKADAFGLLIHPLPGTNDYVRVGVWASLIEDVGGTWLYDDIDEQEVDLV